MSKIVSYDKYIAHFRNEQYIAGEINTTMKSLPANKFFNDVDFVSIVDTIKNVYMSDGSMSNLLDFERVLDEADIYAYKNWKHGELVQGPDIGRYSAKCIFMWPYKLMPDPRGALRLVKIGCKVTFGKGEIDVPVQVKDYEDFNPGTNYPKMQKRKVWFVEVVIPVELMDNIKEGSVDLAGQTIDLSEIDDAYDEDLDDISREEDEGGEDDQQSQEDMMMQPPPMKI
jgi:hypothetical protein